MYFSYKRYVLSKISIYKALAVKNIHELPRIVKIVISSGLNNKILSLNNIKYISHDVKLISNQKPLYTYAKSSIAGFKIKRGLIVGLKVTLRSFKMYEFLDRLIYTAFPRARTFKGINISSFDDKNNLTIGISDYSIFPEILPIVNNMLGLNITICVNNVKRNSVIELFKALGLPING